MKIKDINLFFEKGLNCKKGKQGNILFIPSGAVFPEKIKEDKCHKIFDTEKISKDKLIRKNDILFNSGGVGTLGRVGFYNEDIWSGDAVCDPFVFIIRNNDIKLYSKYLFYYFQTDQAKKNIVKYTVGSTGITSIRKKDILNFSINLPAIEQQKTIVQILDTANNLRQKRKEQLTLLDDYLKSLFLEMFGDPIINQKNWRKKFLKEITNLITDGKHGDCRDDDNSGYYFISAKDIHDGIIDYSQARQILKKDFEEVHRRTNLAIGDLVMVNTGATIGKTAIVNSNKKTDSTTFQKSVAIIKPKINKLASIYLQYVFIMRINAFARISSGSAQKNLLLSQMRDFKIPLPPVKLQNKFASIVEQVEKIKRKMRDSLNEMDNHFNALMQRYFE